MKIKNLSVKLNLEFGELNLNLTKKVEENKVIYEGISEDEIFVKVTVVNENGIYVLSTNIDIPQTPFRENNSLITESPVLLKIEFDKGDIEYFASQYQHRDWWTRPCFGDNLSDVPKKTESLILKGSEGFTYLLPLASNKTKSFLQGSDDSTITVNMTAYTGGVSNIDDVALVFTTGDDLYKPIDDIWQFVGKMYDIPLREEREYPEMFNYMGWCSWDAFSTDVTEEKVLEKIEEFKEKNIPIRWILLDDGWLSVEDNRLYSIKPELKKFPNGFKGMCDKIRKDTDIDHIGVWHAFGGYWGGVLLNSEIHEKFKDNLYHTKNDKLIPHFEVKKGLGFYDEWYSYLKDEGIDFVKVDGQSALKNYYRNNEEIGKVAVGAHEVLEKAVDKYMDGNIINCMGMAIENVLNRKTTGLSRNSDDFLPHDDKSFKEHLLQNAYNALYHSKVYHCDWDMYWTSNKDSKKHGILRAISGGPIYISDKTGETIAEEISPLTYGDGLITKMDRTALPTYDSIINVTKDNEDFNNIALTNTVNNTGAIGVFNIAESSKTSYISPSDVFDMTGNEFIAFNAIDKTAKKISKTDKIEVNLEKDDVSLYIFVPVEYNIMPIGLTDKYIATHSILSVNEDNNKTIVNIREGGEFSFYSESEIKDLIINGKSYLNKMTKQDYIYSVDIKDAGINPEVIILRG